MKNTTEKPAAEPSPEDAAPSIDAAADAAPTLCRIKAAALLVGRMWCGKGTVVTYPAAKARALAKDGMADIIG